MCDILKAWFRSKLGVLIDLTPSIFGHHARDGTLLAKILHCYNVIDQNQLKMIVSTHDPALSRVNLKHLKIWLHFIGVDIDDGCIKDISNGKGVAALQLFYDVFICLEKKDKFYFITMEEERKRFIETSQKFSIKRVSDDKPLQYPDVNDELTDSASVVDWHKEKYIGLLDDYKEQRKKFRNLQDVKESSAIKPVSKSNVLPKKIKLQQEEIADIDEFDKKHKIKKIQLNNYFNVNDELKNKTINIVEDPEAVQNFMKSLKARRQQAADIKKKKDQMQMLLLSELWNKIENEENNKINKIIANKIVEQSQYEKRIVKKLLDIEKEKIRIIENKKIEQQIAHQVKDTDWQMLEEKLEQENLWENYEVEDECFRLQQLYQRLDEERHNKKIIKLNKIALKILDDIIDLSINLSEYQKLNDKIPAILLNEWKLLFFKSLPIHGNFKSSKTFDEFEDEYKEMLEKLKSAEASNKEILDKIDFDNYHKLQGPWNEFIPQLDEDTQQLLTLGLNILGYIVHKLLRIIYPQTSVPVGLDFCIFPIRSVVIGIPDSSLLLYLEKLLDEKKIKLIKFEDAINYCLQKYKDEMKECIYIDLDNLSNDFLHKKLSRDELTTVKEWNEEITITKSSRESNKISRASRNNMPIDKTFINYNKETQTPKVIPYEDMHPVLSDVAYIGKWIYKFMTLGEPLSDELTSKILLQYLRSLKNIDGWVIINYPDTYERLASFEYELTGQKLINYDQMNFDNISIKEIDPRPSRITFLYPEDSDSVELFQEYKLVPNLPKCEKPLINISTLTCFIRLQQIQKKIDINNPDIPREQSENYDHHVDEYYAGQGVTSTIKYKTCDMKTMKTIAQIIIGDKSLSQCFLIDNIVESSNVVSQSNDQDDNLENYEFIETLSYESEELLSNKIEKKSIYLEPKPGDVGWTWANLPVDLKVFEGIALVWKNIEFAYINDLMDIFSLKRFNFASIVPYGDFVMKHMIEFIKRPDDKQELLIKFNQAFNDIPENMRNDDKIKDELLTRVNNFQTELWEICDKKRKEAEDRRKKIIFDYWIATQMINLTNIYLRMIQVEADRFLETIQLINDYYLLMLQRPRDGNRLGKIHLNLLSLNDDKSSDYTSLLTNEKNIIEPIENIGINQDDIKNEISNYLNNFNEDLIDFSETLSFKFIKLNIKYVESIVEKLYFLTIENAKKKVVIIPEKIKQKKLKQRSFKKNSQSSMEPQRKMSIEKSPKIDEQSTLKDEAMKKNLYEEWNCVLKFESARMSLRLKILEESIKCDIDFFLGTMKHTFLKIHKLISERFENEINSVNNMAKVFCNAIERGKKIQEELIFDGDEFSINPKRLMTTSSLVPEEDLHQSILKLRQLERLKDIFQGVSPSGNIPAMSLVYILQDLIECSGEEYEEPPVPSTWLALESQDILKLVHEIFGGSSVVDWREFIIHAMDIEIPSVDELMVILEAFKSQDEENSNTISRENFLKTSLWFSVVDTTCSLNSWSHDYVELDGEQMSEEEITNYKSISNSKIIKNYDSIYSMSNDINPKELRDSLKKKLLCDMFLDTSYSVNYMAMLMAFCKDQDPKKGLTKALSLAVGKKLCDNFDEGEKYIKAMLKKKQLTAGDQNEISSKKLEVIKIIEGILDDLVTRVFQEFNNSQDVFKDKDNSSSKMISSPKIDGTKSSKLSTCTLAGSKTLLQSTSLSTFDYSSSSMFTFEKLPVENNVQSRKITHWLKLDVFKSVMSVFYPQIVNQSDLYQSGKTFNETLTDIIDDLQCSELNNEDNVVLAHRLIHHDFVVHLVTNSYKFLTKNLSKIVEDIINNKKK